MVYVKGHRRGKSIVKAHQRQVRLVSVMGKIDNRMRKTPKTVEGMIRQNQLLNTKGRIRSELNKYAKNARNRALQIQEFRRSVT